MGVGGLGVGGLGVRGLGVEWVSSRHRSLSRAMALHVAKAGEEQLASFAAEQSEYCSICTVTLDPCGDLPFTSWGRWQCLRGGADVGLNSCYSVCGCGTKYRCGETCGDMLEAMARIAPSQPNEAMARFASRRSGTISLDQRRQVKIPEQGSLD